MKVLIYEPRYSGHRLNYVRLVTDAVLELGLKPIIATTSNAIESENFQEFMGPYSNQIQLQRIDNSAADFPGSGATIATALSTRKHFNVFNETLYQVRPEHVLIPTAGQLMSSFAYKMIFCRSFKIPTPPIEALFLGPGHGYQFASLKRRITNTAIRWVSRRLPIASYFHADPYQLEFMALGSSDTDKYTVMPDPTPEICHVPSNAARKRLKIPVDGRYIGICGGISASKGVHDLVSAFTLALPKLRTDDRLLLAGPFNEETRCFIFQQNQDLIDSKRIVAIDKFLSDDDLDLAFNAIDLYCVAQQGRPGSSGTLLRAIAADKPVLARNRFWSGRITKQFNLGWVADTWDREKFRDSLLQCLDNLENFVFNQPSQAFIKFHNEKNFKATWTKNIRLRLKLPPDPELTEWSSITSLIQASGEVRKSHANV